MTEIPRDPEFYYPSEHAVLRKRRREIPWPKISKTLANGRIKNSHEDNCKLFLKQFDDDDLPVGVVANYECGEIVTVEWRK
jgi:hypothetical protein